MREIEKICLEKGLKITEQRKIIAQIIYDANDHPNAEEIHHRSNILDSKISLATVYRTVNILEGWGIIKKLEFNEGKARYEVVKNKNHHHHLIDLKSGKIIEFADEELEAIKEKIALKLGYKLIDHKLELYGIPIE